MTNTKCKILIDQYSADLSFPEKTNKIRIFKRFFPNPLKIRQQVREQKVA